MISYLTNFDFELQLAKDHFESSQYNPVNSALEYLFFWSEEKGKLYTQKTYPQSYFDYIQSLIGTSPEVTQADDELICWWGECNNADEFHREKEINSNRTAHEARVALRLDSVPSTLIETKDDLESFINKQEKAFVIKNDLGFSGKGLSFSSEKIKNFPVVVEPWVQRIRDFGIFISENEFFIVQNNMTKSGAYRATLIKNFLEEKEFKEPAQKIFKYYQEKFSVKKLQIDAFQFLQDSEVQYQFLCEVNHRKSMGQMAKRLADKLGSSVSFFAMVAQSKMKTFRDFDDLISELGPLNYNPVTKKGIISISSGIENFQIFFLSEESERLLQHIIIEWWEKIGKEGVHLPSEFIVNL